MTTLPQSSSEHIGSLGKMQHQAETPDRQLLQ
jgi:hypothetical protein